MKSSTLLSAVCFLFILFSCKQNNEEKINVGNNTNKVVLISVNAPKRDVHFLKQDSIGRKLIDSTGPRSRSEKYEGFTYLDYMMNIQTWIPAVNEMDTLTIECYSDFLEITTKNPFTSMNDSFLLKNGDTVVFNYEYKIPSAIITNREVNDVELNYNRIRLRKLFNDKYTSHYMVFGNLFFDKNIQDYEQNSIEYFQLAHLDYKKEIAYLDSLFQVDLISEANYDYRVDVLNMLMESHKESKIIRNWLELKDELKSKERLETVHAFNLAKTDSLIQFSYFRDYLNSISTYDLQFIQANYGSSGGNFIDSRARFDSILNDDRFNQTANNYLLFEAFNGIAQNFRAEDKEVYFEKLFEHTTNREAISKLKKDYNLDFTSSDELVLTSVKNDTITFSEVIENNKGNWLYIDFWASWCAPCRKIMPASNALRKEFEGKNIEFIYLGLNDQKETWQEAIKVDNIIDSQNYFVENGNVSKVIDDLSVKTIPHYLIYNPDGELINGYANRPGQGAKEQLLELMNEK